MNESKILVQTLKKILKAKGITYKGLSLELNISEASVKRIFSENTFTLDRFCDVCEHIGISLQELLELSDLVCTQSEYTYSNIQESFFVKKPQHLAFFDLLIRFGSVKKVLANFQVSKKELHSYLSNLERLDLIEWLPNDKVKFLTSRSIKWQSNGILRQSFRTKAIKEFMLNNFNAKSEHLSLQSIQLSQKSQKIISEKIQILNDEIANIASMEEQLGIKRENIGVLIAKRPWEFSLLNLDKR